MSLFRTMRHITRAPLNRDRKLASVVRFLKWQIGSRLIPGKTMVPWVNNTRFIAGVGEHGLTGNVYEGLCDFKDMGFVLHALNESDFFVDVGANVGAYTILACGAVRARGACFEPVPETYGRLVTNLALNDLRERVQSYNQGVGDSRGVLRFTTGENAMNHVLAEHETTTNMVEVPVDTLDASLSSAPTMMKIDVEGYETMVFRGATRTFANEQLNALLVELNGSGHRYGFDENPLLETLAGLGFRAYDYDPYARAITPLAKRNNPVGNTLFIRDLDRARQRVREAPPFRILGKSI